MNLKIVFYIVSGTIFFCFTRCDCSPPKHEKPRGMIPCKSSEENVNGDYEKIEEVDNPTTEKTLKHDVEDDIEKTKKEIDAFVRMTDAEKIVYCIKLKSARDMLLHDVNTINQTMQDKVKPLLDKVETLNKSLIEKTAECGVYQALIDLNEVVRGLLEESYPIWGESRKPGDHSPKIWNTVFLNIENSRILKLKTDLRRHNLPQEKFITLVERILQLRNDNVFRALCNRDREKAYPHLLRCSDSPLKIVVKVVLQFAYDVDIEKNVVISHDDIFPKYGVTPKTKSTTISQEEKSLTEEVIHETKRIRNEKYKLRLLIMRSIPLIEKLRNEFDIETELKKIPKTTFLSCYMPMSNDRTACVLFHTFEDAYAALTHYQTIEGWLGEIDYQITAVEQASLFKNMDSSALKVTCKKNSANSVMENVPTEEVTPAVYLTKHTREVVIGETTFYEYNNLEETLTAYQERKYAPNVEVTILPGSKVPKICSQISKSNVRPQNLEVTLAHK